MAGEGWVLLTILLDNIGFLYDDGWRQPSIVYDVLAPSCTSQVGASDGLHAWHLDFQLVIRNPMEVSHNSRRISTGCYDSTWRAVRSPDSDRGWRLVRYLFVDCCGTHLHDVLHVRITMNPGGPPATRPRAQDERAKRALSYATQF